MNVSEPTRPVPHPDRDSRTWWDLVAQHELRLQRCATCFAWRWPPRAICNRCASFEYSWEATSGRGTIASWIVNHHAFSAEFPTPYAVVLVQLAEQDDCKLIGSYAGEIDSLRSGLAVRAAFEDVAAGVTLLTWEPEPLE